MEDQKINNGDATSTENNSEQKESKTISEAKLAANRANSQKSTGAKSDATKKIVSMNGLRHGLTSAHAFVPGDCRADYDALIESHHIRYAPDTDEETQLVQIIAENAWRILKAAPEEAAIYDIGRLKHGEKLFPEITDPERRAGLINAEVGIIYEKPLRNLRLHERRLRKQQDKDIIDLKQMQSERLARIQRKQKEAEQAEKAHLNKARLIVKNCDAQNRPCNLSKYGFAFSVLELKEVDDRNWAHYKITGEFLNFYDLLNSLRQEAA
jgi:hypothetical protein